MKTILDRLQAMERLMPSMVTVIYPDGTQTAVEALKAFEIAVNNRDAIFSVPNNQAMETLLRAVADAVGTCQNLLFIHIWRFRNGVDKHGKRMES